MAEYRIKSPWGRVVIALLVYLALISLFFSVFLAAVGVATEGPEFGQGPHPREELLQLAETPPGRVGTLFGQSLGGILAVLLLTLIVDRRPLGALGLGGPRNRRTGTLAWGLLLGMILAAVVVLFVSAVGRRHVKPELFEGIGAQWAPLTVVAILLAAFAEEWFIRGYLWVNFRERYSVVITIFLTTLVFAVLHSNNPSANFLGWVNILIIGVVIGQLREISGGIQVPIGLHMGWNLTVGVVLGAPVSGISLPSVFRVSLEDLPVPLGGGAFGPEGSLVVTVLFGGVAVLLGRRMADAARDTEGA